LPNDNGHFYPGTQRRSRCQRKEGGPGNNRIKGNRNTTMVCRSFVRSGNGDHAEIYGPDIRMHMSQIKNIIQGWINVIIPNTRIEAIAKGRLEECIKCPSQELEFGITVCGACGCPLLAKARSEEDLCPRGRWNETRNELRTLILETPKGPITNELESRLQTRELEMKYRLNGNG